MIYVLDKVETIVGKRENAGYQHFLLFPQCFQKPSCPWSLKVRIVWQRVKLDSASLTGTSDRAAEQRTRSDSM